MNELSRKRLHDVHPELRERVEATAAALFKRAIVVEVASGLRSYAEQTKLYAQGRTSAGKIVTNARAGSSWHNFGLAVDLCPMKRGKFDWDAHHSIWVEIGLTGQAHSLEWGGSWKKPDLPHLQLRVRQSLAQLHALRLKRTHAELIAVVRPLEI